MAIDFWRQAIMFSLEFPLALPNICLSLFYVILGAWFLWARKSDFGHLRGRRWLGFAGALVMIFPAQAFLILHRQEVGVLPTATIGVLPSTSAISLLGTMLVMAVTIWFGPGPGFLLSLVAGLAWARFYPLTFTDLLAFASWAAVAGWCLYQRYRGELFDLLRHPVLVLPVSIFVPIALFSLSRLVANWPLGALQAVDYLVSIWYDEFALWLTAGLSLGFIFQLIFFKAAWRPELQVDKVSVYNRSLRARLMMITMPLIILSIAASVLAVTTRAIRLAREQSLAEMSRSASNASAAISNFYYTGRNLLSTFSEDTTLLDPQMRRHSLEVDRQVVPFFKQLLLVDRNLEVVEAVPLGASLPHLTSEERLLASRAVQLGVSELSHLTAIAPQEYILTMLQPMRGADNNLPQAVLLGRVNLDENPLMSRALKVLQWTRGIGAGFILDDRGSIIAHPELESVLHPWRASVEPAQEVGDNDAWPGLAYDNIDSESGERTLTYVLLVEGTPYQVVLQLPFSAVLESATDIAGPLLLVQVVGGVILLFALPFFTSRIIKPLNSLSEAANRIARDNLRIPVDILGEDEIAQLGRAFEQMRLRLGARLNDLSLLLNIAQRVSATLDLERGVPPILAGALEETGAAVAHFILLPSGEHPQQLFFAGEDMACYHELDQTFSDVIKRRRDSLIVDDLSRAYGTAAAAQDLRSAAIFPVRVQNATVAVLWVGAYEVELFNEAKKNFISTLASQAAFLVQNARLFQSAEGERRRLAAILSSTSDAILVMDAKAQLALTNPAAQHLLGLNEADHGKALSLLTIPDELVEAFARSDEELQPTTIEVPFEDGRTFLASVAPIMGTEGGVFGKVVVLRDVTHFKELDAMKSEFVETVSHDLRAPLTYIRGYASMLLMVGELNEKQHDYLERILGGIDKMKALISDLLNLRRIDAGVGVRQESCRLGLILVEAIDAMRARGTTKGINLRLEPTAGAPMVSGDRTLLRQAVSNLVDNAIKYTPSGGQVRVGLNVMEKEVRIWIADSGIGIATEDLLHVFEKFYRIKRRETGLIPGTGLGLALVKSIIERHGGRVWVESTLNVGSTFYIALPLPEEDVNGGLV